MTAALRAATGPRRPASSSPARRPEAVAWVALEQNGPWGAKAFTDSHLDPDLGRGDRGRGRRRTASGPSLVRRPGRHADEPRADGRRTRAACSSRTRAPGRTWLLDGDGRRPRGRCSPSTGRRSRDGDLDAVRRSLPVARAVGPAAPAGLHQRHPRRLLRGQGPPGRARRRRRAPGPGLGGHPHLGAPVRRHRGAAPGRDAARPARRRRRRRAAARPRTAARPSSPAAAAGRPGRPAGQVAELAVRDATGELGLDALDGHRATADRRARAGHRGARTATAGRWRVRPSPREATERRPRGVLRQGGSSHASPTWTQPGSVAARWTRAPVASAVASPVRVCGS